MPLPAGAALVLWTATPDKLEALIAGPDYLSTLAKDVADAGTKWAISHPEGQPIVGSIPDGVATAAVRVPLTSGLPWALHVFPADTAGPLTSPRRFLLVSILSLVAVVLSAGWYFIFRSLARERQVARLQSDFVAAVSHEFRSPLTALSHAADLLMNDRLPSDELRRQTYLVLARDTARLRSLVEGLLAFGRIEAGAPYQFDDADVGALVQSAVAEFQEEVADRGYVVEIDDRAGVARGRVDAGAVRMALRNLLDNAVKYSTDSRRIEVTATREAGMLAIAPNSVRTESLRGEGFYNFLRAAS